MPDRRRYNMTILVVVLVLVTIGLPMVYTASSVKAQQEFGSSAFFLKRHLLRIAIGLLLMYVAMRVDYRHWLRLAPWIFAGALILSLLVFVPGIGVEIRGSHRWIRLAGFQWQASDVTKYALVIFLASALARKQIELDVFKQGVLPLLGAITVLVLPILFEPDTGTSGLLLLLSGVILFLGGVKLRHLFLLGSTGAALLFAYLRSVPYQWVRIENYIKSLKGEIEPVWQVRQSLISLGNGGVLGLGLGGSKQKYNFLPDPFTDFILAIVGEELGLLGTITILTLFMILLFHGMRVALRAPDQGGRLLAAGITLAIGIYALVNAAVVVNLLPTTGIPMPFVSYGGSAQVMNLFAVGVLLNISSEEDAPRAAARSSGRRYGRGSFQF
jgi:cell division protein FtsW